MDIGIDTLRSRLDLISWNAFRTWNGGQVSGTVVTGGKPAFAGRHFLGAGLDASGTTRTGFLWGHGEATDCMTNQARPEDLEQLSTLTDAIAPIQAAFPNRQPVTGAVGHVYGAIDANAICNRLANALLAGEFALPSSGRVLVWLNVAPGVALSQDYWAGWADKVNSFTFFGFLAGDPSGYQPQPFRAGVQCRFQSVSGKLRPDPQVAAALAAARTAWRGTNAICHGCWADSSTPGTADWTSFAGGPTPLIWRTTHGFNGSSFDAPDFDVDVTNPGAPVANAIDFMLVTQKWQPNVPGIINFGILVDDPVTQADVTAVKAHDIPQMRDSRPHYAHVPATGSAKVRAIGRYMKPSLTSPKKPTRAEAELLSQAWLDYWTVSEDKVALFSNQNLDYYDQTPTPFTVDGNPASSGTYDGHTAFHYCGDVLRQPPHTPVFFVIDNVDPADSQDQAAVNITAAEAKKRVKEYIAKIKEERDKYATAHPERPYQIGLYTSGTALKWCYEQGILDMFWQPLSSGRSGNAPPNWPWFHANRWQWNDSNALVAAGWTVPSGTTVHEVLRGGDADADWGDGGTWNLRDPLLALQDASLLVRSLNPFGRFEALVTPAAQ
jgi:hypothetical protein